MANEGFLRVCVWPVYAGALLVDGSEPMSSHEYQRGQITWELGPDGIIRGRTRILVPVGEWGHIIYTHHPTHPVYSASQRLAHPLRIVGTSPNDQAWIDLEGITTQDVNPMGEAFRPNKVS